MSRVIKRNKLSQGGIRRAAGAAGSYQSRTPSEAVGFNAPGEASIHRKALGMIGVSPDAAESGRAPSEAIGFNAPENASIYERAVSTVSTAPGGAVGMTPFTKSDRTNRYENTLRRVEGAAPKRFKQSSLTRDYLSALQKTEASRPEPFQSKYNEQVQNLLNTIQNPKSFDLETDDTYRKLYEKYREQYAAQGDQAMRDAAGNAAALTGGYGSTYAMAAGQQARDQYMQALNNNSMSLAEMALNDYWRNRNDKYNQLNAVNAQDAVDYGRHRDLVGDWKDDRNYYANQYQQNYANDYGAHRDEVADWQNNRAYYAGQAQTAYGNDFGLYQSALDQYNAEAARKQAQAQFEASQALAREQNAQAQANWLAEFEYRKLQDALARQAAGGGGRGSSGGGYGGDGLFQDDVRPMTRAEYEKNYDTILNSYDDGEKIAKDYEDYVKANIPVKSGRSFTRSDGKKVDLNLFSKAIDARNYLQEKRAGTNVYNFPDWYNADEKKRHTSKRKK